MGEPVVLDVADFSMTPGGRFRAEGKYSGQEYRETVVEPLIERGESVIIDLDRPEGFQTSFLEEVFGGLVRKYGAEIKKRVFPRSEALPWRAEKALFFMGRA